MRFSIVLVSFLWIGCSHATPPARAPAPVSTAAAARRIPITTPSEEARALFLEGERLRYDAQLEAADDRYRRAVAADPDFARALIRLAGHTRDAERVPLLERARARVAALPPLEARWVRASIAVAEGRGRDVYPELVALAGEAVDDWPVQMTLAEITQFHRADAAGARPFLERAIAADPTSAAPHNLLAYGYSAEGDLDRAVASITRYAELAPGQPNPLDSKGEILLEAGRLDEAEAAFRAALAIDPDFRADDGVAAAQLHRGELAAAIATYEHAHARQTRAMMRWELGNALQWTYLIAGRFDDALAIVPQMEESAAASGHYRADVYGRIFRARVAIHRERWRDALAILDEARGALRGDVDPRAVHPLRSLDLARVRALVGAGQLDAAGAVAVELAAAPPPGDVSAPLAALLVAHARRDLAAAETAATAALLDHRQLGGEARLLLADLAAAAGHAERAATMRRQVASTYGRDPRTYLLRRRADAALAPR